MAKRITKKLKGRNITTSTFKHEDFKNFPCSWYTAKKIVDYPTFLPKNQTKIAEMLTYFGDYYKVDEFGNVQLTKNNCNQ